VKDLLLAVAKEVEESQKSVLQYQLFEEISKEAEAPTTDRKIIVHLNCKLYQLSNNSIVFELKVPPSCIK